MTRVALPVPSRVTGDPSELAPSVNDTLPAGTVVPDAGVTVAVKVTDCPKVEGFCEDARAVVVFTLVAAFTICVIRTEVLEVKFRSPLY